jgi:Putative auto-transporter adhesin, head GIN domain
MEQGMKALILAAIAAATLTQNAYAAKQKLLIGGFQDVVIDGDMQVIVTTGKSPSGTATGERRILDLLRTDRQSDVLTIRLQRPINNDIAIRQTEPLIVTLSANAVRNITLRGNAKLRVSAIDQDDSSKIVLNGGGEIIVDQFNADRLAVNISGTGKVAFGSGKTRDAAVQIEGASIYDAANMKSRKLTLTQNGNATSSAHVEEGAIISNVGAGNITITGNAECFIRKAGSATINCPTDKAKRAKSVK